MSDIIHLLPDSVANQIAAGEVIQRPSSVIKELVENSIDAGATLIKVYITDAGKSRIQVIDNGKGMSETDARLAFERHATSKIKEAADLFALHTMGFRGEALASIAAVAQVELRTRMEGEELGVSIIIEGCRVKEQQPVACPVGANFIVNNLFYNIPARRKFLKSNQTETTNILNEFERIALAHPELSFQLYSNDNLLLDLPGGHFRQRILNIFGKRTDAQLVPVQVETSLARITGFVGIPDSARKKGTHQYFFVNGRYMRHPYFAKSVMTAYERLIPEGEQVSFFLSFEIDPSKIDVNIHPTKTEIKFQDEQALWQILLAAVREALGKYNAVPTIDFDMENRPEIPLFNSEDTDIRPPELHINASYNPFDYQTGSAMGGRSGRKARSEDWRSLYNSLYEERAKSTEESETFAPLFEEESETAKWTREAAVCFQYKGGYIVSPVADGLMIVDQHRAHARILYERYLRQLSEKKGVSQGLLFPQIVEFPPSLSVVMEKMQGNLLAIGFDISNLGGGSYSILGIPAGTEGLDPVRLLQAIVEEAQEGKPNAENEIQHHIALVLSKKAAIPVGQVLSEEEMKDLLENLMRQETMTYTPEGKIIYTVIGSDKIEGLFS